MKIIYLIGVETIVHDSADVVQVQSLHAFNSSGGVLERRQTHVKMDLIQVSTVKRVQLQR